MENPVFEQEQYYGEISDVLKKALKNKPLIYRLTGTKSRIYFTKEDENHPPVIYNSGTTLIDNYRDKDGERAITDWKIKLVNQGENPNKVLKTRQDYGTLLHVLYGKILLGETTSFDELKDFIISFADEVKMKKDYVKNLVTSHIDEFKKDMASFLTWLVEYKVEPLGIEVMLKSDELRVATALDLICYVTVEEKGFWGEVYKSGAKKGEPKETKQPVRKLAIVDFKSGKKGFYKKNVLQLLLSKRIFQENFPDLEVEAIFNLAPNDWLTSPTYKFYDQERDTKQIDHLKRIEQNVYDRGMIEFEDLILTKTKMVIKGDININNIVTEDLVSYKSMEEIAEKYYQEYKNQDVFKMLLEEKQIQDVDELRVFLNKKDIVYLKELSKGVGISYTNKDEFMGKLIEKYEKEYK
ncbi:MAG: hypothetical protein PQJ49_12975 [Sphaerochaetaceae bacterium]|nr:hypothetical protein [Sphaerochaetaceae bacterium]